MSNNKLNKNDEFKSYFERIRKEKEISKIEKVDEELRLIEEKRLKSIQNAIDKYPMILNDFKTAICSDDNYSDNSFMFRVSNHRYNATLSDIHFSFKVAELLNADGFEVIWETNKGWDESEMGGEQRPYDSVSFKLK